MVLDITEKKNIIFFPETLAKADHITSHFLKAVFHKLHVVRSWIPWPIYSKVQTDYITQVFSNTVVHKFYTANFQIFCLKFPVEYFLTDGSVYSWHIILQVTSFNPQNCQAYPK